MVPGCPVPLSFVSFWQLLNSLSKVKEALKKYNLICFSLILIKSKIILMMDQESSLGAIHKQRLLRGGGRGPPSKPIYYISLFSNLSRQGTLLP